ncbi:MAG: hypothetical protein ABSA65_05265 [Acidimicrobiales bacterium]
MTQPSLVRASFRHWPGKKHWRTPSEAPVERIGSRLCLTMFSLPERDKTPECLGLGAFLVSNGSNVLDGGLVYDDTLGERCPEALATLADWARFHPVKTATSIRDRRLLPLSQFNRTVFARRGYVGQGFVTSADLGRTLALGADHIAPARLDGWAEGFALGLRGLGVVTTKRGRREWVRSTGQSLLYVQAVSAHGTRAAFGRPRPSFDADGRNSKKRGVWVPNGRGSFTHYRGRFLDLLGASHGLSGVDSSDLDDHLVAWGLTPLGLPYAVATDPEGAAAVTSAVETLHRLFLLLGKEASEWAGGIDLMKIHSPGGVASQVLAHMGLRVPLDHFDLGDDELQFWMAGLHGGWVTASPDRLGSPYLAADIDLRSAYPTVAVLLGWWEHLCAEAVERRDVTDEFARFLAMPDLPARMRDPKTWRKWGVTRVVLRPRSEPLPVEVGGDDGKSRLIVVPTDADRFDAAWPDAVLATALSERPVEVLEATQLVPVGRQRGLRTVQVLGTELDPREDPAVILGQRRRQAKGQGEWRRTDTLRSVMNAMVWGNLSRFDPRTDGGERPGPWCWPPLASTVTAGSRCLLALAEVDLGPVGYLDTDGAIVALDPAQGTGNAAEGASDPRLAAWLSGFDPFDAFGDGTCPWEVKAEGTAVVFGPKRYVISDDAGEVLAFTEHVIGAFVPPPGTTGLDEDGQHLWTRQTVQVLAKARMAGLRLTPSFPWEDTAPDFPALRRQSLSGPEAVSNMPPALGLRAFSRIVQGISTHRDANVVAPDPGGDLANWRNLDWHDARTGKPVSVTTDPGEIGSVLVDTLRARAVAWARPPAHDLPDSVRLDPLLCRLVGKGGGAFLDGSPQAVLRDVDAAEVLSVAADRLDTSVFVQATGIAPRTARRLARGTRPRRSTVDRALLGLADSLGGDGLLRLLERAEAKRTCRWPGCDVLVEPSAVWCRTHRRRSGADRARARERTDTLPRTCAAMGCDRPARSRSSTCSEACKRRVLTAFKRPQRPLDKPTLVPVRPAAREADDVEERGRRFARYLVEGRTTEDEARRALATLSRPVDAIEAFEAELAELVAVSR